MFIKLSNGVQDIYVNTDMIESFKEQIYESNGIKYNSRVELPNNSNESSFYLFTNTVPEIVTKIETLNSQKRII